MKIVGEGILQHARIVLRPVSIVSSAGQQRIAIVHAELDYKRTRITSKLVMKLMAIYRRKPVAICKS
ncbi:hypothetical protein J6590_011489 [Homalodisca vitripennis]|nr:hypothetical protein J6590_011489 [Homalodisca vitripennis]